MKATMNEFDGDFTIELIPEDMKECLTLIRFGINARKRDMSFGVYAHKNSDQVNGCLWFYKYQDGITEIKRSE